MRPVLLLLPYFLPRGDNRRSGNERPAPRPSPESHGSIPSVRQLNGSHLLPAPCVAVRPQSPSNSACLRRSERRAPPVRYDRRGSDHGSRTGDGTPADNSPAPDTSACERHVILLVVCGPVGAHSIRALARGDYPYRHNAELLLSTECAPARRVPNPDSGPWEAESILR